MSESKNTDSQLTQTLDDALEQARQTEGMTDNALPTETLEGLQERIHELEQQIKDEQLRTAAQIQNLNRRHQEELQAAHKFSGAKFAQEMLPIKDYLEMALQDNSQNFDILKTGVDMTLKQLIGAFEKTNISEINPLGEKLDPNKHQAVSVEESDEEAQTIIKVMQKGYMLHERILRPAMVVVAKEKSE